MSSIQWCDRDFAKINWVAFALKCYPPAINAEGPVYDERVRFRSARIELWLFVLEDQCPVDEVLDRTSAVDFEFRRHPLISMAGLGTGVDAVLASKGSVHDDVGSRSAEIAGSARSAAIATKELAFD